MKKKSSRSSPIIHALIVSTKNNLLSIPLSGEYCLALDQSTVRVLYSGKKEVPVGLKRTVASFHTLFGINGSGKTEVLLDIASVFQKDRNEAKTSVLYAREGNLYLFLSTEHSHLEILSDIEVSRSDLRPKAPSVFYTSSPFENRRRSDLVRSNSGYWLDVSPRYADANLFDGLSLAEAMAHLPEGFIDNAQVEIGIHLLSLDDIYRSLSTATLDHMFGVDGGVILARLIQAQGEQGLVDEIDILRVLSSTLHADPKTRLSWAQDLWRALDTVLAKHYKKKMVYGADGEELVNLTKEDRKNILWDALSISQRDVERAEKIVKLINLLRDRLLRGGRLGSLSPQSLYSRLEQLVRNKSLLRKCITDGLISFTLEGLSSGETAISMFYTAINSALMRLDDSGDKTSPVFILIDEGEMFLHPSWQRKYVQGIHRLVESFKAIAPRTHILVSTHSLIVAADTPPDCLIDIENARRVNGFGLGPKSLLEAVYQVDDLPGDYSRPTLEMLAKYFQKGSRISREDATRIVQALADDNVREYLLKRIAAESQK
ncbi:AAA family ATPase [Herbaspirillum camelliae]|uniref:AAA family ATPase n=1 Tax=Herbaspirillum camelliae TaxID=1892903 RepID=UPI000A9BC28A|nr:AAA family ATPase [Herbaspirillum camelliae]